MGLTYEELTIWAGWLNAICDNLFSNLGLMSGWLALGSHWIILFGFACDDGFRALGTSVNWIIIA